MKIAHYNHIIVVASGIKFRYIKPSTAINPITVTGIIAFLKLRFQIKGIKHLILL
jgi:hypothetical protein